MKLFEHVAFSVKDAAASSRFYEECFGAKVTNEWISTASTGIRCIFFIDLGGTTVELIQRDGTSPSAGDDGSAGIKHICLGVENLDAELARLQRMGVRQAADIVRIGTDRYRPVRSDGSMDLAKGMRRAVVLDPDGIEIELLEK